MIIDLANLDAEPSRISCRLTPEQVGLDADVGRLAGELALDGTVAFTVPKVFIEGQMEFEAEVDCSRCLEAVGKAYRIDVSAAFTAAEDFDNSEESEVRIDDLDIAVLSEGKIDLAELAREQVLLNLPEHMLCNEDCRGLCPACGINRNLQSCKCEEDDIDPRWLALKELKK
jgi:uncharacterized protein